MSDQIGNEYDRAARASQPLSILLLGVEKNYLEDVYKRQDIGKLKYKDIQRIEHWINNYPRRIFGYRTANEMVA